MDDKDILNSSPDQFGFLGGSSLPDPVASPSTYNSDFLNGSSTTLGGLDSIPDPVASPDSYQDFDIPEIDSNFDVPSVDDIVITSPPPEPTKPVIPTPTKPVIPTPPIAPARTPIVPTPDTQTVQPDALTGKTVQPENPKLPRNFDFSSDDFPMPDVTAPRIQPQKPRSAQNAQNAQPAQNAEDSEFTGHMVWNGTRYVESDGSTFQSAPRRQTRVESYDRELGMHVEPPPQMNTPTIDLSNLKSGTADSIWTLSLIALISGLLCCGFFGLVLGIIGLRQIKSLQETNPNLTEREQSKLKTAKVFCIIGIGAFALSFFSSFMLPFIQIFNEF